MDNLLPFQALEQLQCPVCLEIPPGEIVQCKSGHTICAPCQLSLKECPVCLELYGLEKIRNRQMEFFLDMMKFPCLKKELGCLKMLTRGNILEHLKVCDSGCEEQLQRKDVQEHAKHSKIIVKSMNICQLMGFKCSYKAEKKKVAALETHLKAHHGALVCPGSEAVLLQEYPQPSTKFWRFVRDMVWTPVLFQSQGSFLVLSYINGENKTISWITLHLDDEEENKAEFHVNISISPRRSEQSKSRELKWSQECVKYLDVEDVLRTKPFQVPLSLLKEGFLEDGNYLVKISIERGSDENSTLMDANFPKIITVCSPIEFYPKSKKEKGTGFLAIPCDKCGKKDSTGVIFVCLQCHDFVLCNDCFSPTTHAVHLFTLIQSLDHWKILQKATDEWTRSLLPPTKVDSSRLHDSTKGNNTAVTFNTICDECHLDPIVGMKFKCLQCPNYDLCETCAGKGCHSHHIFAIMMNIQHQVLVTGLEKDRKYAAFIKV